MKTLYLIRHAKSSWNNASLQDFDRPLNDRGKKNALEMGTRLLKSNDLPDFIISSSAKRTKKTAKRITRQIKFNYKNIEFKDNLYHCSALTALKEINAFSNQYQSVYLIGHNPTMSDLCDYLTGIAHPFPTSSIAKIEFKLDNWKLISNLTGTLKWIDFPKNNDQPICF